MKLQALKQFIQDMAFSENASFAKMLEDHKLTFIGPKYSHIEMMGDKIEAKKIMKKFGVPTVPGSEGEVKVSLMR